MGEPEEGPGVGRWTGAGPSASREGRLGFFHITLKITREAPKKVKVASWVVRATDVRAAAEVAASAYLSIPGRTVERIEVLGGFPIDVLPVPGAWRTDDAWDEYEATSRGLTPNRITG